MSNEQERAELHRTIWKIANDLRGAIGGWEFKSYVLGTIFYRYISENMTDYINGLQREAGGDPTFDYARLSDEEAEEAREMVVQEKGYFILPSQLFVNVTAAAPADENLNQTLSNVFRSIESSAQGQPSEDDLRGLFSDFAVNNELLGHTVGKRNELLAKVLQNVAAMQLAPTLSENKNDVFGDAYEYLMQMYAASAGKSGGEFFTPEGVSELLARLATEGNAQIRRVYDPACGSGSLLLKFAKTVGRDNPNLQYYGQEINPSTYNLCRINMFLHGINFSNFNIALGDTLTAPAHLGLKFDAIVSNPPYSVKWAGDDNPLLINDARFSPASVLAPKSKADLAFTMHMLAHLAETGKAAIVEFPGVLYRGGAEQKIRRYLLENNFVETVIQLPVNLFYGVTIATCIIVLRKSAKPDNEVLFVDASNEYIHVGNKNQLSEDNQKRIAQIVSDRKNIAHVAQLVTNQDIIANNSNLSVSSYVEQPDTREKVVIADLNKSIQDIMKRNEELSREIDRMVAELEGGKGVMNRVEELIQQLCPNGVEWKKLGEVCDLIRGKVYSKDYLKNNPGDYPVYSSQTANNGELGRISTYDYDGEFLTWTTDGAYAGTIFHRKGRFSITNVCGLIKIQSGLLIIRFLYYWLSLKAKDYVYQGMGNPKLMSNQMETIPIPIPPLPIQQEIVRILDTFTELQKELTANLQTELDARRKQYEYYRDKLLTFDRV